MKRIPFIQRAVSLCLCTMVLAVGASSLSAQNNFVPHSSNAKWNVFDGNVEATPVDRLVKDYQLNQLKSYFEARRADIAGITTPEQFEARQKEIRNHLHQITGPFPQKTPLNPQVTGRIVIKEGKGTDRVV